MTENDQLSSAVTPKMFRQLFPEITVGFDWQRFAAEAWPVERRLTTKPTELARFHTFFRYSLGRINGHFLHWLFMRQMRVQEVVAKLERIPERDKQSIQYFAKTYAASAHPIALSVPAYALPGGGQYIMDLNHRLCGLALSGAPFELEIYSIQGPVTREVINDAVYCRERP